MRLASDAVGPVRERRVVSGVLVDGVDGRRLRRRRRRILGGKRRVVGGDVETLDGDRLERSLHVWIAIKDRVKVFDGQREQVAVGVSADAGDTTSVHQQTDLCFQHQHTDK